MYHRPPKYAAIKKRYVEVRRVHHLKLADAIIAATALALDIPLTQKSH
jgi:predicted nucleic acid-binding protein